jgi:hypothetical protein
VMGGRCPCAPPVEAHVREASGGSGGPSWLGGRARAVVIWCGIGEGLARKMVEALVLQGGVTGVVFYRGSTLDMLHNDTRLNLSPNCTSNH